MDAAVYETHWMTKRYNFADNPACQTSGVGHQNDLVGRCSDNCYVIPDYGRYSQNEMDWIPNGENYADKTFFSIHSGGEVPSGDNFEDHCISDRRNYYCTTDGLFNEITGKEATCAQDEDKRRNYPIFFTNKEWLESITSRAKYMGDCGYKEGIYSESLEDEYDSDLEQIWVAFTKLDNQGEPKDELVFEKIYEGFRYGDSSYLGEGINIPGSN
jgi:hypothetical protein